MAFERREGDIGGKATRYADGHLARCPYCKAVHPLWLSDAKPLKSDKGTELFSYQFQCPNCSGIIEYVAESEKAFDQNDGFESIKLINPGRGTNNLNLIDISLSPDQMYSLINSFGVATVSKHVSAPDESKNIHANPVHDDRKVHAILGMIFGIVGLTSCFAYGAGIIHSIPGLILSVMGLKSTTNHKMAVAGMIMSIIGLVIEGFAILFSLLLLSPFI